jgi:hypothetical protein
MSIEFNDNHLGLFPTEFAEWQIDMFYEMFNFFKDRANVTENLRFKGIPELLHSYLVEGKIKKPAHDDLIQQLQSSDPENWLIALAILKRLKDVQSRKN